MVRHHCATKEHYSEARRRPRMPYRQEVWHYLNHQSHRRHTDYYGVTYVMIMTFGSFTTFVE